jgi:hypothetical protein
LETKKKKPEQKEERIGLVSWQTQSERKHNITSQENGGRRGKILLCAILPQEKASLFDL